MDIFSISRNNHFFLEIDWRNLACVMREYSIVMRLLALFVMRVIWPCQDILLGMVTPRWAWLCASGMAAWPRQRGGQSGLLRLTGKITETDLAAQFSPRVNSFTVCVESSCGGDQVMNYFYYSCVISEKPNITVYVNNNVVQGTQYGLLAWGTPASKGKQEEVWP